MQLDGLATGMDTTSMIDQLVALESQPIVKYQEEISELEETQGAWRDVNSRLDKLENLTTDLKMSSTFESRTAESSNEDAVTATASNDAFEGNYEIEVFDVARSQRLAGAKADSQVEDSNIALKDLTGFEGLTAENTITINETDITINDTDTLNDLTTKINDANAGVRASVVDNQLVLETTETGLENALDKNKITDSTDDLLNKLGILNDSDEVNVLREASDAKISINGIQEITSTTNTFDEAVDGVKFEISPEAEIGSTATISVAKDTQKAVDAVQGFVDQYNSTMDFLDGKTDYDSEEEEAAILQGDSTAMRLQMRLRGMVTGKIKDSGDYKTLSSVGIEVDRDGVMSFDSGKFTEAINNSAEEVKSLFNADTESDGYDGMAERVDGYLDQLMRSNTGVIPRRIDFFNTRIDNLNDDIADVKEKVEMTRQRYVEEFTAMEEAISEMNQQQSWMQNQLSGMGGMSSMTQQL